MGSSRARYEPRPSREHTKEKGGRIDGTRRRWARTDDLEFIHYVTPDGEAVAGEGARTGWGDTHILHIVTVGGTSRKPHRITVNFSEMTAAEITAVQETLNTIIAQAQEVCELRDQKAREAFDAGDDGYYRIYRQVPVVVDREGSQRRDDPSVPGGPDDVPEGDGDAPAVEVRGERPEVSDAAPEEGGSEDDPS